MSTRLIEVFWCLTICSFLTLQQTQAGAPSSATRLCFDFGALSDTSGSAVVNTNTTFSPQRGYGWLNTRKLALRHRSAPNDARRNFIMGVEPATFRIAGLPPGNYRLTVVSGDMDYGDHATRVRIGGEGETLPTLSPAVAEFATLTKTIASSGVLDIEFDSPKSNWVVNSLTLEPTLETQPAKIALNRVVPPESEFSRVELAQPGSLPEIRWHLTARPWQPVNAPRDELVDQMDRAVRAMAPLQFWDEQNPSNVNNGSIIDPFDHKEIQYGTPLFAFNVAVLLQEGRCTDLVEPAARALDRATRDITDGMANDWHGEFFCAPMVKAIRVFEKQQTNFPTILTPERLAVWKQRMKVPRNKFMGLQVKQNWRTFASKGEWLRQQDGYITNGVQWIENNWTEKSEGGQRERFRRDLDLYQLKPNWFFYHDDTADPETFAYNGATTANLLDALLSGYDGASAPEMRDIIRHNLRSSLLLMSGSGEAPGGGRTGEHIWDDSIYANAFQAMAELAMREGDQRFAGQLQHAVELLLKSHARFQQENGWFSITKNRFPPALKNRYATWSGVANYLGFTLACCAETLLAQKRKITEQPAPSEIGGYSMELDPEFASVFMNAGGMGVQLCKRGETDNYGGVQWHVLGITRFSRQGWDGRLGPGAGHVVSDFSDGVSFSPTFFEDGQWKRVCLDPKRFQGRFKPEFVHPLLVRGTFTIGPVVTNAGPTFEMQIAITPDGVLVDTKRVSGTNDFGIIWPLFEFDGRTVMNKSINKFIASTAYPSAAGKETILAVGNNREWKNIDGGYGGATEIGFRYSLDAKPTTQRTVKLVVNGVAQPAMTFLSTGGTNFWHQLYVPVALAGGKNNTIQIEFVDNDNKLAMDELRVRPAVISSPEPDQQNFIALRSTHRLDTGAPAVRGGYGDFLPGRVTDTEGGSVETFVYPSSAGDPDAETVRASFHHNGQNFSSVLGRVVGNLYVGRTSAGGEGRGIDLDNDGKDDVSFDHTSAFILQLDHGRIIALESDRAVTASIAGKLMKLAPYSPVSLP